MDSDWVFRAYRLIIIPGYCESPQPDIKSVPCRIASEKGNLAIYGLLYRRRIRYGPSTSFSVPHLLSPISVCWIQPETNLLILYPRAVYWFWSIPEFIIGEFLPHILLAEWEIEFFSVGYWVILNCPRRTPDVFSDDPDVSPWIQMFFAFLTLDGPTHLDCRVAESPLESIISDSYRR